MPPWLVSFPPSFHRNGTHHVSNLQQAADANMHKFEELRLLRETSLTAQDGESLDALEHFFWGMEGGTVMELGALDGRPESSSVSFDFLGLGWHRVLVEGNPTYKEALVADARTHTRLCPQCVRPQPWCTSCRGHTRAVLWSSCPRSSSSASTGTRSGTAQTLGAT